ncbi:Transcriptional regulator [Mycoemilia scoparia]|uniref:Transcriptional regulator n=1 Tax=Mycoemilia scoparia TaxID=417184 RepID=A0A9W8A5U6_9FUNG|nr:Transcriptional regulator [Mycoemilia scoparia]
MPIRHNNYFIPELGSEKYQNFLHGASAGSGSKSSGFSRRLPNLQELDTLQHTLEKMAVKAGSRADDMEAEIFNISNLLGKPCEDGIYSSKNEKRRNSINVAALGSRSGSTVSDKRAASSSDMCNARASPSVQDSFGARPTNGSVSNSGIPTTGEGSEGGLNQKIQLYHPNSGLPLIEDDFTKVKITSQTTIQAFWTSVEPYFRNLTESDIKFLQREEDNQESYIITPLGKPYLQQWTQEEVALFPELAHSSRAKASLDKALGIERMSRIPPRHSYLAIDLSDADLVKTNIRCAPITERIICSLVRENIVPQNEIISFEDEDDDQTNGSSYKSRVQQNSEVPDLESRLKQELRYIGILGDEEVDWKNQEDDEISASLRALQSQLREQVRVNRQRNKILLSIAKKNMGYQEYLQIMDELDKQVEQSYGKRNRAIKSRKRKSMSYKPTTGLSENTINAMDRRRRVMHGIGHLFPPEKFKQLEEKVSKVTLEETEPTVDKDAFAGLKKKKKKKSKKLAEDDDDLGSDSEKKNKDNDDAVDEDDAFSGLKKKKKKSKKSKSALLEEDQGEQDGEENKGEGELEEPAKDGEPWLGTDRDYLYTELLGRLYAVLRENNPDLIGEKRKFTIVPPQMVRDGSKKSIFANTQDIANRLGRPLEHLIEFIFAELGTSGSKDKNGSLIIKGRFQQKQMETVLRKYIIEYVTCKTCKSGDTELLKENRITYVKCRICGSSRSVTAIKTGFQAQTTKRKLLKK